MAQAAIPIAAAVIGSAVGAGASALIAPKPRVPQAAPMPSRLQALQAAAPNDEFRKRRGAAANIVTGPNGAEAPSPGAKALLGQ